MLTDISVGTQLMSNRRKVHDILRALVQVRGVDVNIPIGPPERVTPLMMAIEGGDVDLAHLYLDHGADVLAQDASNETALDKLTHRLDATTGVIDPSYEALREELQQQTEVLA